MMSTTGDPGVGQSTDAALSALLAPPARTRSEAIERVVATLKVIGSPGYELDEEGLRERSGMAFDRGHDPIGVGRQLVAILASGIGRRSCATCASRPSCSTVRTTRW